VTAFFAGLEPCLVGMEACSTSHYWAREIGRSGHVVRLMLPAYVKPHVKRGKNDAADAEANSSKPGDTVLDCFGGSGTTMIAAERTGRRAVLLEINPAYADVIARRWQETTGEEAVLDGEDRAFKDIAVAHGPSQANRSPSLAVTGAKGV
jgi:hypothetical protein